MSIEQRAWWRAPVINRRNWRWEDAQRNPQRGAWWQNATIYQLAPWSFLDTTGSGTGDLNGIVERLDYIASLGVDAIWLTPIYASPMDDLGYDVEDLGRVGAAFGTREDFRRLLDVAHAMKLGVIIDQVWNHTSDRHPWFGESRRDRDNPRADWYVWADPGPDGGPPNNWLSSFTGGSAWHWNAERGQYYLAHFLASQPDLNLHHRPVREAILDSARSWLDEGVDGLRIDAVNFFTHDRQLRDNPLRPDDAPLPDGVPPDNPLVAQILCNSFNRDETLAILTEIRAVVDEYPGVVTLGEVTLCEDSVELAGRYVAGSQRLHMAYHSGLLVERPMDAPLMRDLLRRVNRCFGDGGVCWIVGNHDYGRLRGRWTGRDADGEPYPEAFYRMMAALLLSLPGAFCLWQGDELGLPIAEIPGDIPAHAIRDPFGKALYPDVVGRDGSRTPMPWDSRLPNAGFTCGTPWLPVPDSHRAHSVRSQHRDPASLLNLWRQLLHWRRNQPALEAGNLEVVDTQDTVLVFERRYAEHHLLCLFNIAGQQIGRAHV